MPKLTTQEFITKARAIHGNHYNYDEVEYKDNLTKVKIFCPIHNEYFYQRPQSHLQNKGCTLCGKEKWKIANEMTTEKYIEGARKLHGDKYDYSKVEYKGMRSKITIICKEHGEFIQDAFNHKKRAMCPKCTAERLSYKFRDSVDTFIKKSKEVHGDFYDYSLVDYKNQATKVLLVCPKHGKFSTAPNLHISQKCGCPKCALDLMGWTYTKWEDAGLNSKHFDGFKVYVIECWYGDERFYKIGKTFIPICRRFNSKKQIPYEYKVIKTFEGSARYISELEQELQNKHKKFKYKPKLKFKGQTECFTQYLE